MSRLGKTPIPIPRGIELKVAGGEVHVKGPKGSLSRPIPDGISIKMDGEFACIEKDENVEMPKTNHGLYRALINNLVIGVSKGFEKRLGLVGVGYRANLQGQELDLQLGFSHPTKLKIPKTVTVTIEKNILIIITGVDKHAVGQFAATIRSMKPPEPYKGKGIRYEGERVRKKAGKAAKGKTAA